VCQSFLWWIIFDNTKDYLLYRIRFEVKHPNFYITKIKIKELQYVIQKILIEDLPPLKNDVKKINS